jgi:predicted AlkP superfamily pyrophosphatase or phosphodiesterase
MRLVVAIWLALVGGAAILAGTRATEPPLTLLISIDGFRPDYLQRGVTPALAALAADGVRAEAMWPSFPTLTFPNHYTLVTGLRPDHHGIVDNTMEDARKPGVRFAVNTPDTELDPFWWNEAEPVWVTAERMGIRTATMFWPGSDVRIRGMQPHDWKPYDASFPADQRVAQVLAWLDRPAAERPRFVTLYFGDVDRSGHEFGPDAPQLTAALASTDASLARLVAGLRARGVYESANVIVVSDHGMAPVSPERVNYLDDVLPASSYHALVVAPMTTLRAEPGHESEVAKALLAPHDHFTCWRKTELPVRFHYGRNPRILPFVCLAHTGWDISSDRHGVTAKGTHGFDPDDPLMAALFVAHGPAFRSGVVLKPFDNVDVYPLLARLIGIKPRPNDGRLEHLASALAR